MDILYNITHHMSHWSGSRAPHATSKRCVVLFTHFFYRKVYIVLTVRVRTYIVTYGQLHVPIRSKSSVKWKFQKWIYLSITCRLKVSYLVATGQVIQPAIYNVSYWCHSGCVLTTKSSIASKRRRRIYFVFFANLTHCTWVPYGCKSFPYSPSNMDHQNLVFPEVLA